MRIFVAATLVIIFSVCMSGYSDSYQMGEDGPEVGEDAPGFSLTTLDGKGTVTLSDLGGKKPVVLVFGSYT